MTVLITGANGQLGQEVQKLLAEKDITFFATDKSELDITNKKEVFNFFSNKKPTVIFHCGAYTAVDLAEDEGKDRNYQINVEGTRNIAEASEAIGAKLIYISTDYVFDGSKHDSEYAVSDQPNPQNEYGKAKLLGEVAVKELSSKYYIIRTSWVFGEFGKNFVFTMKNLAKTHDKLTVVNDQFGRPTWTRSLAEFMLFIEENQPEFGTYHFSNDNSCSWYEFAREILKDEAVTVEPVDSSQFPQKATRPIYSIMDLSKVKALGFKIETWQVALQNMLGAIK